MNFWNAQTYCQFLDLRTQPARDLLAAFPCDFRPNIVYDLGCGPGNSTILLKHRWPNAKIVGLDVSDNMLKSAKASYPELSFIKANIADFSPLEPVDCLFANASLQWIDEHEILFPKLLKHLRIGGAFAIQMPNNFHAPSHQVTVEILKNKISWQPLLKKLLYGKRIEPLYQLPWYYDLLKKSGVGDLHLWETDYFQEMADYQAIFDWGKGTGLKPILSEMDIENQTHFKHAYIKAISEAYPLQVDHKVLLPYKRIFMLGFRNCKTITFR